MEFPSKIIHIEYISISVCDLHGTECDRIDYDVEAHMTNDIAVMKAYGMPIKETNEASCVAWLMKVYQEKVNKN